MAQKKMTMTEQYEATKALLNGETVEKYSIADAIKFIDGRIVQVAKKNAPTGERKLTKVQIENECIKEQILTALGDNGKMSVGNVMKAVDIDSNQKVTSLLTQLRVTGKVVRTEEKGVAYYALATEG